MVLIFLILLHKLVHRHTTASKLGGTWTEKQKKKIVQDDRGIIFMVILFIFHLFICLKYFSDSLPFPSRINIVFINTFPRRRCRRRIAKVCVHTFFLFPILDAS